MNLITKSRGNLRAFRAAASLLILSFASCSTESFAPLCESGDCSAVIYSNFTKDVNGYYHAELDWTLEYYPYFVLDIEADRTSREYWYNDQPAVTARFDTDTYFVLGDSLAFVIPLYRPYGGLETYGGVPIAVQDTIIYLNQFKGTIVPVIQNDTRVYFSDDEFGGFTTKRTVGPFPPSLKGDTITVFMKVYWDGGYESQEKDHYIEKFIIE